MPEAAAGRVGNRSLPIITCCKRRSSEPWAIKPARDAGDASRRFNHEGLAALTVDSEQSLALEHLANRLHCGPGIAPRKSYLSEPRDVAALLAIVLEQRDAACESEPALEQAGLVGTFMRARCWPSGCASSPVMTRNAMGRYTILEHPDHQDSSSRDRRIDHTVTQIAPVSIAAVSASVSTSTPAGSSS